MNFPFVINTDSVDKTEGIGAELARLLIKDGTLPHFVAMYGDLGVGKTAFVRGFCSELCPNSNVKSPTFALVNEYKCTNSDTVKKICHFDMYRVTDEDDLYSIGYDDYLRDEAYPQALRSLPQWVLWRLEPDKNGRPTKVPYSANYAGKASSTNPVTWASFDKAVMRYREAADSGNPYSGIGFVITKGSGLIFIDIDHCISEDGTLNEVAYTILKFFEKITYCEVSQSGTGLHIFVYGTIPYSFKNGSVEMYDSGRYCAITGNAFWAEEPQTDQSALDQIFENYKTQRNDCVDVQKIERNLTSPVDYDDNIILQKMLRNENARMLYFGQWEGKYPSQSEADQALCALLAFYCEKDRGLMDRLFRSSALMRPKWDEVHDGSGNTYGEMTIAKACAFQKETLSEYRRRKRSEFIASQFQYW